MSGTCSIASKTCLAKNYPAVEVAAPGDLDLILAIADDFSPTAVEERADAVRLFFASAAARDAALTTLASRFRVEPIDVSDEDWARRSQEHLSPVTVGRITIFPNPESRIPNPKSQIPIVIVPSMGFGTGHHATTRLCLAALQTIDLDGKTVLDVGTGSGVLAIAADRLGAARAVGIDIDPDAIQSANENLLLNPEAQRVSFAVGDLNVVNPGTADVVIGNLSGALLVRSASTLLAAARGGGGVIVSGLQAHERERVRDALASPVVWEREDDGWLALILSVE